MQQPFAYHRSRGPGRLASLLLAVLVMLGLSTAAFAAPGGGKSPSRPAVVVPASAVDAVAAMQPSWNLGNTLDAIPDETSWATRPSPGNCWPPSTPRATAASASR